MLKDRFLIDIGTSRQVGNGKSIRFWIDRWTGQSTLRDIYPNLYPIAYDQHILVSQLFANHGLNLVFARQLTGVYLQEWKDLITQFQAFQLSDTLDSILWRWSNKGKFSVHSLYSWLEYGGVPNLEFKSIWNAKLSLKIKIFLWLTRQNKILTRDNLIRRGWQGDLSCVFCSDPETVNYLFVTCKVPQELWKWIADFNMFPFDCTTILDLRDLDRFIPMKDYNIVEITRGAVLWNIWLERNRIIFRRGTIRSVQSLGVQIVAIAQFWCQHQRYDANSNLQFMLPFDTKGLSGG